jgi:hypothetical protein
MDCASFLQPFKSNISGDLYSSMAMMRPKIQRRGPKRILRVKDLPERSSSTVLDMSFMIGHYQQADRSIFFGHRTNYLVRFPLGVVHSP